MGPTPGPGRIALRTTTSASSPDWIAAPQNHLGPFHVAPDAFAGCLEPSDCPQVRPARRSSARTFVVRALALILLPERAYRPDGGTDERPAITQEHASRILLAWLADGFIGIYVSSKTSIGISGTEEVPTAQAQALLQASTPWDYSHGVKLTRSGVQLAPRIRE